VLVKGGTIRPMKRILIVLGFVLASIPSVQNSNAADLVCPIAWTEKMPTFKLESVSGASNGMPYQRWSPSLVESDGTLTDQNPSSPLNKRISSYGTNIEALFSYQVSTKEDFSVFKVFPGPLTFFHSEEVYIRLLGISNGDYIRYSLDAYVKGCEKVRLVSNSYQLNGLLEDGPGIEKHIEVNPASDINGKPTSFADTELIRSSFQKNVASLLANPVVNKPIPILRAENPAKDFYLDQFIVGISPSTCISTYKYPYPESVRFISLPCKFGFYARSSLTDFKREGALAKIKVPSRIYDWTLIASYTATGKATTVEEKKPDTTKPTSAAKVPEIKKTIICIKGKLTKKVTAAKPVCPSGYKKK
jgi:hypothetical protein